MRKKLGILLILGSTFMAGAAAAGPGQCFDFTGQPIGPVYDTDHPNYHWLEWVQARRGTCSRIKMAQADALRARGLTYPPNYYAGGPTAPGRPGGYTPPGTGPDTGWYGDAQQARRLVRRWYFQTRGVPAQVWDRGETFHIHDRAWHIFYVSGSDGQRSRMAVRLRRSGSYAAMISTDGYNWSAPFDLGV